MRYVQKYWDDVRESIESIVDYDSLYNKNIMITGASGMICSSIIDVLLYLNKYNNAGITIFAAGRNREKIVDRFSGFNASDGLEYIYYDSTSRDRISINHNIDYIIHGASNANPSIYMKEPVETMMSNILGLENVLCLAAEKHSTKVLYISSSEVYGQKKDNEPYFENDYGYLDILNQRASYPSSKRAGESLCIAYGQEYCVSTVIVRPGHIYGPSIQMTDNRASAQFTRNAVEGKNIIMKSKGEQLRSYCYTLDCASAILTVLINGKENNAYNISNPNSVCTISDIAHTIAETAGVQVIFDLPTEEEQKSYNLMNNSSLNSEKLEALGWTAKKNLHSGVESMIKVLKKI